jgi:uncharacterized protein (DUF1501 family)
MYDGAIDSLLHSRGESSSDALDILKQIRSKPRPPANGAEYPRGQVGRSLSQIATLIKSEIGLRVAFADCVGWDTHVNQGGQEGQLAGHLRDLGDALAAFYRDLGDRMEDVVVLTMSEFGRTVAQNGTGGTDHGHGTCFFLLGGEIRGGKVLGKWPGLRPSELYEGRDLAVTTDYRDLFAEIALSHLGVNPKAELFPGYAPKKLPYSVLRS